MANEYAIAQLKKALGSGAFARYKIVSTSEGVVVTDTGNSAKTPDYLEQQVLRAAKIVGLSGAIVKRRYQSPSPRKNVPGSWSIVIDPGTGEGIAAVRQPPQIADPEVMQKVVSAFRLVRGVGEVEHTKGDSTIVLTDSLLAGVREAGMFLEDVVEPKLSGLSYLTGYRILRNDIVQGRQQVVVKIKNTIDAPRR